MQSPFQPHFIVCGQTAACASPALTPQRAGSFLPRTLLGQKPAVPLQRGLNTLHAPPSALPPWGWVRAAAGRARWCCGRTRYCQLNPSLGPCTLFGAGNWMRTSACSRSLGSWLEMQPDPKCHEARVGELHSLPRSCFGCGCQEFILAVPGLLLAHAAAHASGGLRVQLVPGGVHIAPVGIKLLAPLGVSRSLEAAPRATGTHPPCRRRTWHLR